MISHLALLCQVIFIKKMSFKAKNTAFFKRKGGIVLLRHIVLPYPDTKRRNFTPTVVLFTGGVICRMCGFQVLKHEAKCAKINSE